jgi:hypothetical protein
MDGFFLCVLFSTQHRWPTEGNQLLSVGGRTLPCKSLGGHLKLESLYTMCFTGKMEVCSCVSLTYHTEPRAVQAFIGIAITVTGQTFS